MERKASIRTQALSIGHAGKKGELLLAEELELSSYRGELLALVGPNGCGKSTLLRTLAGLHRPLKGEIWIGGERLDTLSPKARAKRLSIVLTGMSAPADLKVRDLVSLGRTPHRSVFSPKSETDRKMVEEAMEQCGILHLANKGLDTLSDGESQRAGIARALAQDTESLLLDEPTAHLDLINRVEIGRMLRGIAREREKTVIMSSHDLELILRIADRVWVMTGDGRIVQGIPEELALNGVFSEVFSSGDLIFDHRSGSFRFCEAPRGTLRIAGEGPPLLWTRKALERIGFETRTVSDEDAEAELHCGEREWILHGKEHFSNLEALIRYLNSFPSSSERN